MDALHDINAGTSIPDSIILKIFSYLSFRDLCKAAQVCHLWRRIALDNSLHEAIDVRSNPLTESLINKLVTTRCTAALHDLRLRGYNVRLGSCMKTPSVKVTTLTPALFSLLERKSPQLRSLTIEDAYLVDSGPRLETSVQFGQFPRSVQHLSLYGSILPKTGIQNVTSSKIICLNLGQCNIVDSNYLRTVIGAPSLRVLYLQGCKVSDRGLDHLFPILPQLQVLDLEATSISDRGVVTLFQNCVSIEELYIGHTYDKVTNEALRYLKLGQMPKLSSLCAVRSGLTSDMDDYIRRRLPGLHFLKLGFGPKGVVLPCHHHLKHKCPVLHDRKWC